MNKWDFVLWFWLEEKRVGTISQSRNLEMRSDLVVRLLQQRQTVISASQQSQYEDGFDTRLTINYSHFITNTIQAKHCISIVSEFRRKITATITKANIRSVAGAILKCVQSVSKK